MRLDKYERESEKGRVGGRKERRGRKKGRGGERTEDNVYDPVHGAELGPASTGPSASLPPAYDGPASLSSPLNSSPPGVLTLVPSASCSFW